jgi:hypothetical protein
MAPSHIWLSLCRCWGVPDSLRRVVWEGLRRVQGRAGVALRQSCLWHDSIPDQLGGLPIRLVPFPIAGLLVQAASPAHFIEALEPDASDL